LNADREAIASGATLDGFVVGELLHQGGMALVYAARGGPADGPLVVKVPRMGFGSHPACYVFFETEQMILASLSGPHVPRLVAKGAMEDDPYIVMERIEGPSLSDYARRAPLAPGEVARLLAATATAVHALHRQNVVHLDLKPANVRFRPGGEAVLIDFGLARHAEMPDLGGEAFHVPVGTGSYISPEQLGGVRSDPRSDIFALGVIAYQLATGAKPFGDPTSRMAMRRRLFLAPIPPRALNAAVPQWLQEVILRCLEVRAEDRYATAAQLAHDLAFPEQVPITERGRRLTRPGMLRGFARWLGSRGAAAEVPSTHLSRSPHLLVAIDLEHGDEALAAAMRNAVTRAVAAEPGLRVTVMSVVRTELFAEDASSEIAHAQYVDSLVALRHWAAPLRLSAERLRFHVAEGTDPAHLLLAYAAAHQVDRIIMGARGASRLRRYLGSVSSRVVAEAACSVSVIRPGQASQTGVERRVGKGRA
jgi:nucleotide-binding universal stress UspA family protein